MENQVLTFFFWRPTWKNTARGHDGLQQKKKKVNTWFSMGWTVLLQIFCSYSKFFSALEIKDCPLK